MTTNEAVSLMFGGSNRQGKLNDLRGRDGTALAAPDLAVVPRLVTSLILAFDSRRKKAILHGGRAADGLRHDTWSGSARWSERQVTGPGLRLHHAAADYRKRGRLVVYGGVAADGQDGAAAH